MTSDTEQACTLKVAIILDSCSVAAWKEQALREILALDFVDSTLILIKKPWLDRLLASLWSLSIPLFLYQWLDFRVFRKKSKPANAFQKVSIELTGVKYCHLELAASFDMERPLLNTVGQDVIVDLTTDFDVSKWRDIPAFGIWSVVHGDARQYAGTPPMFWEIYHNATTSGVTLQSVSQASNRSHVLYRSYSKTHPYSLFLNRNEAYWKSSALIARRLSDLYSKGWEALKALDTYREPVSRMPMFSGQPNGLQMLKYLGRILVNYVEDQKDRKLKRYQYAIAYKEKSHDSLDKSILEYQLISPPKSAFWADPFLIKVKGKNYILFENYSFSDKKGVISYLNLSETGTDKIPELALERDYHLSYPFLFEHRDEIYMIPETSENRTIELYRAVQFPDQWVLEKVLMHDVDAHDATLFEHNQTFWLFVNIANQGGSLNDELFLFYSKSLFGEWQAHPKNPILSDVSLARSAGKLFSHNGRIIRPSQDCSKRYGYALNFNHVQQLTETEYQETLLYKVTPDNLKDYCGVHTYNSNDDFEVIDLARFVPPKHARRTIPDAALRSLGPDVGMITLKTTKKDVLHTMH